MWKLGEAAGTVDIMPSFVTVVTVVILTYVRSTEVVFCKEQGSRAVAATLPNQRGSKPTILSAQACRPMKYLRILVLYFSFSFPFPFFYCFTAEPDWKTGLRCVVAASTGFNTKIKQVFVCQSRLSINKQGTATLYAQPTR